MMKTDLRLPKGSPLASLSLAFPGVSLVIGFLVAAGGGRGTGGDMIGYAFLFYAGLALGTGGLIGAALAVVSILRKENAFGCQLAGLLLSFVCLVPGAMSALLWLRK